MKKLLLFSLLCGSTVVFSMKRNYTVSTKLCDHYLEQKLETGENIDNIDFKGMQYCGEMIKPNSIITVRTFLFPNKQKQYGTYNVISRIDKKKNEMEEVQSSAFYVEEVQSSAFYVDEFCEKAKKNDFIESPFFYEHLDDIKSFKATTVKVLQTLMHNKKLLTGEKVDDLLDVIDEQSAEKIFPIAWSQKNFYEKTGSNLSFQESANREDKNKVKSFSNKVKSFNNSEIDTIYSLSQRRTYQTYHF